MQSSLLAANPGQSRIIAFVLIALVFGAHGGALTCGFVGLDDPNHLLENRIVRDLDLVRAFTDTAAALWIPLTWISFIIEYALAGFQPWVYHLTNVALHALNAVLLWRWLEDATRARWQSVAVAVCFAVHPLNVESVAWITERKNVLSTAFWLLSLIAWTRYGRENRARDYVWALVAAAAAMMSKPMAVTLGGTLLLADLWPLERWRSRSWKRLLLEKVPFVAMAIGVVFATMHAHAEVSGMVSAGALTMSERLLNVAASYGLYLRQLVWPFGLAIFVRHPQQVPLSESIAGIVLLIAISIGIWKVWRKAPAAAFGWLWYLGTLLPVSGLTQAGSEASADRFFYVPGIGILIGVSWLLAPLAIRSPRPALAIGFAVVVFWIGMSVRQVGFWDSSKQLFDRGLVINPNSRRALVNGGVAYAELGDHWGAISRFRKALEIKHEDADTWTKVGHSFEQLKDPDRAAFAYEQALKTDPEYKPARTRLAALPPRKPKETNQRK